MNPKFQVGENVSILNQKEKIGTVNQVIDVNGKYGYKVMVDGKILRYQEKYLVKYVDEEEIIIDDFFANNFGDVNDFNIFQTWYRLKRPIQDNLYSYLGSKTLFNPYQFKPVLKFLSHGSEERLFIADEVGVGKTIETGIILTELIGRGRLNSNSPVWIVCPNALGPKWVKEMKNRFNFKFHLHDSKSLKNALVSVLNTGKFDDYYKWSIVSLQLLRHVNYFDLLKKIDSNRLKNLFSMVIIDEAHHLRNKSTESNELGNILSGLTDMMIMLSATPLNLRDEDLFNQMNILNPSVFPDYQTFEALLSPVKGINRIRKLLFKNSPALNSKIIRELNSLEAGSLGEGIAQNHLIQNLKVKLKEGQKLNSEEIAHYDRLLRSFSPLNQSFTRTLKRDAIKHRVTREAIKIGVELSSEELDFYNQVIKVIGDAFLARGGESYQIGFVTNIFHRMVSSCIPAMKEYLHWALDNNQVIGTQIISEEFDNDSQLKHTKLTDSLREQFKLLSSKADNLEEEDSKYNKFKILVNQLLSRLKNPQIIVFSFFLRTLKYLKRRLEEDGYRVGLISGEVPLTSERGVKGRYEIMEDFQDKKIDILLSSEVGGEGLDFQFCQAIINYDLPYNPMRIEQRIGRIDRFGQNADKIFIASMYIKNTIDEKIFSALFERIKLVEDSVGILEPILGDELLNLQNDIISGDLTSEQMEKRIKEIKISLANSKKELERFENNRKELLGEEYFIDTIRNLHQTNFVKPNDAIKLTEMVTSDTEGCDYQSIDEYRGEITLSKELQNELQQFRRKPGFEKSSLEIKDLLVDKNNLKFKVVFDGQKAIKYPDYTFLSPCGYWTKFLLQRLEDKEKIKKVFILKSKKEKVNLKSQDYIIPLFEVEIEGFRIELYLAAVPIEVKTMKSVDLDFVKFTRSLNQDSLDNVNVDFRGLEKININRYIDLGQKLLECQMENKMIKMKEEHRFRLKTRINSLKRGSEVRIERLERKLNSHKKRYLAEGKEPSKEFVRMIEAQISNERKRIEEKIDQLKQKKNLTLTISLVSINVLQVS